MGIGRSAFVLSALAFSLLSAPVFAQSYEADAINSIENAVQTNAWQDLASAAGGRISRSVNLMGNTGSPNLPTSTGSLSDLSVNTSAYSSAQFNLGFGAPGPQTGSYGSSLPPVATSSVNLSVCDLAPSGAGMSVYSGMGPTGASDPAANLPPPPGPGYQPIMQHGVFVGYMSPDLISMMQSDPTGAWTSFANSPDFVGPEGLRLSLLAETGAASPDQMAQLEQMALFGM